MIIKYYNLQEIQCFAHFITKLNLNLQLLTHLKLLLVESQSCTVKSRNIPLDMLTLCCSKSCFCISATNHLQNEEVDITYMFGP